MTGPVLTLWEHRKGEGGGGGAGGVLHREVEGRVLKEGDRRLGGGHHVVVGDVVQAVHIHNKVNRIPVRCLTDYNPWLFYHLACNVHFLVFLELIVPGMKAVVT